MAEKSSEQYIVLIKNQEWKEGDPTSERYINFFLPPDVFNVEVRPTPQGYCVYFARREEHKNPSTMILDTREERVSHTEHFFNGKFEEVGILIKYTDWTPTEDRSILPADWKAPKTPYS